MSSRVPSKQIIQAEPASLVGSILVLELSMKTILILMLGLVAFPAFAQEWRADSCESALAQAYTPFSARTDAPTSGDFNGDGQADFALFLDNRASHNSAIGVCLSREPRPLLITAPYQTAKIFTKPKGTAYTSAKSKGVYELDTISVSDGAKSGASYILRAGVFARVVDGAEL